MSSKNLNLDSIENVKTKEELELDRMDDLDDDVYEDVDQNNDSDIDDNEELDIEEDSYDDEEVDEEEPVDEEETDNDDDDNDVEIIDEDNKDDGVIKIDIGNKVIEVDNEEELLSVTRNALRDKLTFEKYKEDIAVLEGIKKEGLTEEELYLLVEAKKGNKKALTKLLKSVNFDPNSDDMFELEDEDLDNYKPKEYKVDTNYIEIKSVFEEMKQDEDKFKVFEGFISRELTEPEREQVFKDPTAIKFIADLIKTGIYDEISPHYLKNKLVGKKPMEALIDAYDKYTEKLNKTKKEYKEKATKQNKIKSKKRKSASAGIKKMNSGSKKNNSKVDFLEMSDEEFEKYYSQKLGFYI